MKRLPCLALAACLPTLAALGQMAEQPGVDLQAGLIIADVSADAKGHLNGVPDQGFSDLTLSFTFEQTTTSDEASSLFSISTATDDGPQVSVLVRGKTELLVDFGPPSTLLGMSIPKGLLVGHHHIVLVVKRDPRQALSSVWFDGVECGSFMIPPGQWQIPRQLLVGPRSINEPAVPLVISHLCLYNRAMSRPEVLALAARDQPPAPHSTIALLGSTEAVLLAESGWLDVFLGLQQVSALVNQGLPLRTLAWEGDTVFRRTRPLSFGSLDQQLARTQAHRSIVMFGRQECLERGEAGLADFRAALEALVAECPAGLLLVGCVPFEHKAPPQRDLAPLNAVLARYDEAIRAVALSRGGTFLDTAKAWPLKDEGWTRDGITLTASAQRSLAELIARAMGWKSPPPIETELARLRTLAQAKEVLWHRYWRPSNWAFLYGDRTTQPSSRDHLNPNIRWFPKEIEQYRDLIDAKENELWKLSHELGRKLP